jgi:hypothetical protein
MPIAAADVAGSQLGGIGIEAMESGERRDGSGG